MFDLAQHRDDLVRLIYDVLKIWITLSIITPIITKSANSFDLIIGTLSSTGILILGIILRQGEKTMTTYSWIALYVLIITLILIVIVSYLTYGPKGKGIKHGA